MSSYAPVRTRHTCVKRLETQQSYIEKESIVRKILLFRDLSVEVKNGDSGNVDNDKKTFTTYKMKGNPNWRGTIGKS